MSYRDHICGHSVSNEQNDVLSLAGLLKVTDFPGRNRLGPIVVIQSGGVQTRVLQVYSAIGFGGDIYE
jgi:hypothetical protein